MHWHRFLREADKGQLNPSLEVLKAKLDRALNNLD